MYALALVRYRKPLDQIELHLEAHRAYLRDLNEHGIVLASGPLDPRNGGALLIRIDDDAPDSVLDAIRDNDPFVKAGVAQYELQRWNVVMGKDALDKA